MTETKLPLIEVPIVDYGTAETEMVAYREEGTARALISTIGVQSVLPPMVVLILRSLTLTTATVFTYSPMS